MAPGSCLEVPFADLVRLGRAAPALESLTLTQPRFPAGLSVGVYLESLVPVLGPDIDDWEPGTFESRVAPSCLHHVMEGGTSADALDALDLLLGGPIEGESDAVSPSPFPRLRVFVLDGQ